MLTNCGPGRGLSSCLFTKHKGKLADCWDMFTNIYLPGGVSAGGPARGAGGRGDLRSKTDGDARPT